MESDYQLSTGVSKARSLAMALTVVIVTMAGEFFFRHYFMYWFPAIGDFRVNDMISLVIVYAVLMLVFGSATHTRWGEALKVVGYSLRDLMKTWDYLPWVLSIALCGSVLPFVDRYLWGSVKLMPWLISPYRDSTVWFMAQAPVIRVVALVSVNGFFVPIAEEFLWRGIVQARLLRVLPTSLAIGITAVLFSFKHVLVDDSFGRLLFLTAFGVVCGIVAHRKSWQASASVHMFINTIGTVLALASGSL